MPSSLFILLLSYLFNNLFSLFDVFNLFYYIIYLIYLIKELIIQVSSQGRPSKARDNREIQAETANPGLDLQQKIINK